MSYQGDKFTAIANAIRAKKGTTASISANDFASEIASIPGGGGTGEPYEVNSEAELTAFDIEENIGLVGVIGTAFGGYSVGNLFVVTTDETGYLRFYTADNQTISVTAGTTMSWDGSMEYSNDGGENYSTWSGGTISGTDIRLRGTGNTRMATQLDTNNAFIITGTNIRTTGECASLLDYQSVLDGDGLTLGNYGFCNLFRNCSQLLNAEIGNITNIGTHACRVMFAYCSSLIKAPKIPAITSSYSYYEMFAYCEALKQASDLYATIIADRCYRRMFAYCTALKMSLTQTEESPLAYRIPSSGTISATGELWNVDMFVGTGGTYVGDPSINTTYYQSKYTES